VCGRYASSRRDVDLIEELEVDQAYDAGPAPSWNVAPTQDARVVVERVDRERPDAPAVRQLRTLRWGLVPSWADDPLVGSRMINARAETVTVKPAFAAAASKRRCLVPADGYYEWERRPGRDRSVPTFLHADGPLWFAGLYEFWADPALPSDHPEAWLATFTIVTTKAADSLGHIHERSPVVVPAGTRDAWLDPRLTALAEVDALLRSLPAPALLSYEVSPTVNDHRNNGPDLVVAV
jgi:putative SOS response-associated peptidase YedK